MILWHTYGRKTEEGSDVYYGKTVGCQQLGRGIGRERGRIKNSTGECVIQTVKLQNFFEQFVQSVFILGGVL